MSAAKVCDRSVAPTLRLFGCWLTWETSTSNGRIDLKGQPPTEQREDEFGRCRTAAERWGGQATAIELFQQTSLSSASRAGDALSVVCCYQSEV